MKKSNNHPIIKHLGTLIMLVLLMSNSAMAQYGREDYTSKDKFTLFQKWYESAGVMSNLEDNKAYYNKKFSQPAPEGSSAMHKKYNHQIVFSKEPIIYGKEDESKFTVNFKYGDNIYAMAYFSYTIQQFESFKNYNKMTLIDRTFPDGNVGRGSANEKDLSDIMEASKNKSYLSFYIMKPTTDTSYYGYSASMCNYFSEIYFRQNTQFFTSVLSYEAFGLFNYDLSGTTKETFNDMSKIFYKAGEEAYNKKQEEALNNLPMPKEWFAKSFPVTGGMTEAEIKAAYISLQPEAKVVKLYAAGGTASWVVDKNEIGIPLDQHYTQLMMLFCKDGKYCWQAEVVLQKDYLGAGKYGKVYAKCIAFDNTALLPCNKMK